MDDHALLALPRLLAATAVALLALLAPTGCDALLIRALRVPAWVPLHQSATLSCQYDAQGEPLYSVKWYKNKQEFYRWLADERPNVRIFEMDGLHIDAARSNDTILSLTNVAPATAGEYTCEVSVDAPTFLTAVSSARLNVASLPSKGPQIAGLEGAYVPGQTIFANCSVGPSAPRVTLRWFLNGKEVDHRHLAEPSTPPAKGALPAWRALQLPVETTIFKGRRAELRCVATVGELHVGSADFSAVLRDTRVPGNLAQYSAGGGLRPSSLFIASVAVLWVAFC